MKDQQNDFTNTEKTKNFYYTNKGSRIGPCSRDELLSLLNSHEIDEDTSIWREGYSSWKSIRESEDRDILSELKTTTPPPLSGNDINNSVIWILAFAPLIGLFTEGFVAGLTNKPVDTFWFITLAINIGLSYLDEKKLEAAGVNTEKFGNLAFLVPAYIFLRFRTLKQPPYYFIVWIATFLISCAE